MLRLLEAVAAVLVVLWLIGFLLHVGGELIHLVLVVGIIVLAIRFFQNKNLV